MKVLVVDDSRAIRGIISKHLVALGFEVLEASGGVEALTQLKHLDPDDLVLLDWNMPEMDGFDVAAAHSHRARIRRAARHDGYHRERDEPGRARRSTPAPTSTAVKPFNREALVEKLVLLGIDLGEAAA